MADALTEIDLDELQDTIESEIAAAFPVFRTVEFYRADRKTPLVAPACELELAEFETEGVDPDPGTGQLAVYARFEARLVLGFRTDKVKRAARKLAGSLAAFLHERRWTGMPTGEGQVSGCYKDEFDPELDQYEVWRVEWEHIVHLGQSVWKHDPSALPPTTVSTRAANPQGAEVDEEVQEIVP